MFTIVITHVFILHSMPSVTIVVDCVDVVKSCWNRFITLAWPRLVHKFYCVIVLKCFTSRKVSEVINRVKGRILGDSCCLSILNILHHFT